LGIEPAGDATGIEARSEEHQQMLPKTSIPPISTIYKPKQTDSCIKNGLSCNI